MSGFRFSTNIFGIKSLEDVVATCRRAEGYGYDTIFTADHLGLASPFSTLIAAANATERLRVGTLVLNAPFWNPALLAREIATTDVLTGGRFEVGLGAGYAKWEFSTRRGSSGNRSASGWTWWLRPSTSLAGFSPRTATTSRPRRVKRLDFPPLRPVQRRGFGGYGPPLLVGGTGDRVLRIAARNADIIGIAGAFSIRGQPPHVLRIATAAEIDERVRYARECAGQPGPTRSNGICSCSGSW